MFGDVKHRRERSSIPWKSQSKIFLASSTSLSSCTPTRFYRSLVPRESSWPIFLKTSCCCWLKRGRGRGDEKRERRGINFPSINPRLPCLRLLFKPAIRRSFLLRREKERLFPSYCNAGYSYFDQEDDGSETLPGGLSG